MPATTGAGAASTARLWALRLLALIGAGLSFNAVRLAAEEHAGFVGGIATALLFDLAMWLAARWYIDTVRAGQPMRPVLWLALGLIGATLGVNVHGADGPASAVVHGIGPALFAAFTWIEATIELRAYRKAAGERDRVPLGEVLIHPGRALRVWLMMTATGTTSYTAARAMCQNREARRRTWAAAHRPAWIRWLHRRVRPGWRSKVDPVEYVAYRWGAFTADAHVITAPTTTQALTVTSTAVPAIEAAPDTTPKVGPDSEPPAAPLAPPPARRRPVKISTPEPARREGLPPGVTSTRGLTDGQLVELVAGWVAGRDEAPTANALYERYGLRADRAKRLLSDLDLTPGEPITDIVRARLTPAQPEPATDAVLELPAPLLNGHHA